MSTEQAGEALVNGRYRQVAEPLTHQAHLRQQLNDTQGEQLLTWAMTVLKREAMRSAHLPDEEALPLLEQKQTAVVLVMQLVNDLVANPHFQADEDIVSARLVRLGKNLFWLTQSLNRQAQRRAFAAFRAQRDSADADTLFQLLLDIIHAYEETPPS